MKREKGKKKERAVLTRHRGASFISIDLPSRQSSKVHACATTTLRLLDSLLVIDRFDYSERYASIYVQHSGT